MLNRLKAYSTHMPMLIRAVEMADGPVVEVGAGIASTPLLHWLCKILERKLITYENDPEFYGIAKQFQSKNHKIRLVKSWEEMDFVTHYGVVLIDHAPAERRGRDAIRFSADYIVCHDSERPDLYGYDLLDRFKYRFDYMDVVPFTTVVSDFCPLWMFST